MAIVSSPGPPTKIAPIQDEVLFCDISFHTAKKYTYDAPPWLVAVIHLPSSQAVRDILE